LEKIKNIYAKTLSFLKKHYPSYKKQLPWVLTAATMAGIYSFALHQNRKHEVHVHKEKVTFNGGRTIGDSRTIYQMKEKILSKRVEELEKKTKSYEEAMQKMKEEKSEQEQEDKKEDEPKGLPEKVPKSTSEPEPLPEEVSFSSSPSPLYTNSVPPYSESPTRTVVSRRKTFVREATRGPSVISFPVQAKERVQQEMTVKVPAGSYLKAKLLTGVEASESRPVPVLLQADFFFIGPNKSKIDLAGCFIIAKSQGNLSIERVEMQANKISCVSKSGRMFERELNGFMADGKDSSFGIVGLVNSKQDRVASMAFLSSIVQGIGSAIQQAQTSTQTNALGGASSIVTGDQAKYMAAGGVSNAASLVTNWYLQHAQNLLPTINIGSGQDVWIVLQDTVDLPNWYFARAKSSQAMGSFSYLSRLNE